MRNWSLLLLLCAGPAFAQAPDPAYAPPTAAAPTPETFTHGGAGFQVDCPVGWKSAKDGDLLTFTAPDSTLAVSFFVLETKDLKEALDALDVEVGKAVSNLELNGQPKETQINGLDAILAEGRGKVGEQPVDLGVALLKLPAHVVLVFGVKTKDSTHAEGLDQILKSIHAVTK